MKDAPKKTGLALLISPSGDDDAPPSSKREVDEDREGYETAFDELCDALGVEAKDRDAGIAALHSFVELCVASEKHDEEDGSYRDEE